MKNKILESTDNIRQLLAKEHKFNEIRQDKIEFNRCHSSLDVIEDTQEAISYYKNNELLDNIGYKYLVIYGLFEAFYVQQQAVIDFTKAIFGKKIKIERYKNIYQIREYRNDIAGHPTLRDRDPKQSTYLNRNTLEKIGFSYQESNQDKFIEVNIIKCIEEQEKWVLEILKEYIENLKEIEFEHYKKFKDIKLMDIFSSEIDYYDVLREIQAYDDKLNSCLEIFKRILKKLKDMVNERFISWERTNFKYCIEDIEKIINFIENKLSKLKTEDKNDFEFIKKKLIENLCFKIEELKEYCKNTDKQYEEYFNDKTL